MTLKVTVSIYDGDKEKQVAHEVVAISPDRLLTVEKCARIVTRQFALMLTKVDYKECVEHHID